MHSGESNFQDPQIFHVIIKGAKSWIATGRSQLAKEIIICHETS
jgi:hypothetical protein